MVVPGQIINPDLVPMTGSTTVDSFSTPGNYYVVQLRKARYDGGTWVWVRVYVNKTNNYNPGDSTVQLSTLYGVVSGYASGGNINSGVANSRSWSNALCVGTTGSGVRVKYSGACVGNTTSKTITL